MNKEQEIKKKADQEWNEITGYSKPTKCLQETVCSYCKKPKEKNTGSIYHESCKKKQDAEINKSEYDPVGMF